MTEQWIRWEPIQGLSCNYCIDSISDSMAGFKIVLSDAGDPIKKVKVIFENSVDAFRNTDESFRLRTMSDLNEQYGTSFFGEWTFFKVENSSYASLVAGQSCGIFAPEDFMHFSLITVDSIVDIINPVEPRVEFFLIELSE